MDMKIVGLVVYNLPWTEAYFHNKWHLDPSSRLATIDIDQKIRGAVPFWGKDGSPSNTIGPVPRSTSVPSGILIYTDV